MAGDPKLARLLEHPALWRGSSAASRPGLSTGFAALDEQLPGKGWPRTGLIEILVSRFGSGELYLLLPALATLTRARCARWCVWVAPPLLPFAPALASRGVVLDRVAIVSGAHPLWAFEQALGSGACDAALAWARQPAAARDPPPATRRRAGPDPRRAVSSTASGAASLPLPCCASGLEPSGAGVRVSLLKGRSLRRGAVDLPWPGS